MLDRFFSPICVLGLACLAETGFNIGLNLADGGATLVAAYREEMFLRSCSPSVRHEILNRCLATRWTDGLVYMWPTTLRRPSRFKDYRPHNPSAYLPP